MTPSSVNDSEKRLDTAIHAVLEDEIPQHVLERGLDRGAAKLPVAGRKVRVTKRRRYNAFAALAASLALICLAAYFAKDRRPSHESADSSVHSVVPSPVESERGSDQPFNPPARLRFQAQSDQPDDDKERPLGYGDSRTMTRTPPFPTATIQVGRSALILRGKVDAFEGATVVVKVHHVVFGEWNKEEIRLDQSERLLRRRGLPRRADGATQKPFTDEEFSAIGFERQRDLILYLAPVESEPVTYVPGISRDVPVRPLDPVELQIIQAIESGAYLVPSEIIGFSDILKTHIGSASCVVRARLTKVGANNSTWQVLQRLYGRVEENTLELSHDEFQRRAGAVVRYELRQQQKTVDASQLGDRIKDVTNKLIAAELKPGVEAVVFVRNARHMPDRDVLQGELGHRLIAGEDKESLDRLSNAIVQDKKHSLEPFDARKVLSAARDEARRDNKSVFAMVSSSGCEPCLRLREFLLKQRKILELDFVFATLDRTAMIHGRDVVRELRKSGERDVPWVCILGPDGEVLATSDGPRGNIGFPFDGDDVQHYAGMLKAGRNRITDEQFGQLEAALTAICNTRRKLLGAPPAESAKAEPR